MKLTKHDYEMIADILDAHYEDTVEMQRNHYLNDDTDYFKQLEYLEELISIRLELQIKFILSRYNFGYARNFVLQNSFYTAFECSN